MSKLYKSLLSDISIYALVSELSFKLILFFEKRVLSLCYLSICLEVSSNDWSRISFLIFNAKINDFVNGPVLFNAVFRGKEPPSLSNHCFCLQGTIKLWPTECFSVVIKGGLEGQLILTWDSSRSSFVYISHFLHVP